jgi:hypothetical protein
VGGDVDVYQVSETELADVSVGVVDVDVDFEVVMYFDVGSVYGLSTGIERLFEGQEDFEVVGVV